MMYMTLPEARKLQAAPMCITKFINEEKSWCMCADEHGGNCCALLTVSSHFVLQCRLPAQFFFFSNAAALHSYCSNFRLLSAGLVSLS